MITSLTQSIRLQIKKHVDKFTRIKVLEHGLSEKEVEKQQLTGSFVKLGLFARRPNVSS